MTKLTPNEERIFETASLRGDAIGEMIGEFINDATKFAGNKLEGLTTDDRDEQRQYKLMLIQTNGSYIYTGALLRKLFRILEERQISLTKRRLFGHRMAPVNLIDTINDVIAGKVFKELIEHADELQELASGDRDEELAEKRED